MKINVIKYKDTIHFDLGNYILCYSKNDIYKEAFHLFDISTEISKSTYQLLVNNIGVLEGLFFPNIDDFSTMTEEELFQESLIHTGYDIYILQALQIYSKKVQIENINELESWEIEI